MDGGCDICLRAVQRAARHCESCSASLCASHLEEHAEAPESSAHETVQLQQARAQAAAAPANQGPPPQRRGAAVMEVSWLWLLAIPIVLMAMMIDHDLIAPRDAESEEGGAGAEPSLTPEERTERCQQARGAVEEEHRSVMRRLCVMRQQFERGQRAMRERVQREYGLKEAAFPRRGDEGEEKAFQTVVLPLLRSHNSILLSILDTNLYAREDDQLCKKYVAEA